MDDQERKMELTAEGLRSLHNEDAPPAPTQSPRPGGSPRFRRGASHVPSDDGATDPQKDFIRTLLAERAGVPEAEAVREKLNRWRQTPQGLTKAGATAAITDLKAIPRVTKAGAAEPQAFRARPNKFDGECDLCGRRVPAGEGLLTGKGDDGKWLVVHAEGECQPSDFPFPFGRYALNVGDEVKFYVANEDGLFAQASDELFPIRSQESRDDIIAAIAVDPMASAILYGQQIGVCGRCGRTLTSEWRERGIGPVCVTKGWG
jgi:hypothetical protein